MAVTKVGRVTYVRHFWGTQSAIEIKEQPMQNPANGDGGLQVIFCESVKQLATSAHRANLVEAVMRLRALSEIEATLSTQDLLALTVSVVAGVPVKEVCSAQAGERTNTSQTG